MYSPDCKIKQIPFNLNSPVQEDKVKEISFNMYSPGAVEEEKSIQETKEICLKLYSPQKPSLDEKKPSFDDYFNVPEETHE